MKHIFGKKAGQSGFSLVELMIVVGIIGVLATLALPRFKQFQAKAKMAEAQNVLQHIYTLEQSYALDNTVYAAVASIGANTGSIVGGNACNTPPVATHGATLIGLQIEPCSTAATAPTPRFAYIVTTAAGNTTFVATAQTGAATFNRICPANGAFNINIDQGNVSRWGVGATGGATQGTPQIGTVCPN